MDKNMIEKKITAVTEQIRKDEAESERTAAQIRRAQDRKHFLESRLKENRRILSDLKNRKAMLAIEGSVGRMDDAKLALKALTINGKTMTASVKIHPQRSSRVCEAAV